MYKIVEYEKDIAGLSGKVTGYRFQDDDLVLIDSTSWAVQDLQGLCDMLNKNRLVQPVVFWNTNLEYTDISLILTLFNNKGYRVKQMTTHVYEGSFYYSFVLEI